MTPAITAGLPAAQSLLGGLSALQKGRAERQQAETNAFIGETRAIQTATAMQEQLGSELGTLRATFAANGQGLDAGTMPFIRELRRTRLRERRVGIANERQGAADWRQQGRNASAAGTMGFLSGVVGAGPSMFNVWNMTREPK